MKEFQASVLETQDGLESKLTVLTRPARSLACCTAPPQCRGLRPQRAAQNVKRKQILRPGCR